MIPGDKSISHRAIMLGAIADGITEIENCLLSEDTLRTIDCFRAMGIRIDINDKVIVYGKGLYGLSKPDDILYTGNSGTTTRLILGILAGQGFSCVVDGDSSIKSRPMNRVIEPLLKMGAKITAANNNYTPITITGSKLKGIIYNSPLSSAQVKSAVLLASLYADGPTTFIQPYKSRNHTEKMLQYFGVNIEIANDVITIYPVDNLKGQKLFIPSDISSASYFITLALLLPNFKISLPDIGINPTRTGIIDIYKSMGAKISIKNVRTVNNEKTGDITAYGSDLKGVQISGSIIPRVIDEIPIIAVAATQANGITVIKDAAELKVKESDRIKTIATELNKMGANIKETNDGMIIKGPTPLHGANVDSHNDHRIAMSLAVAGKIAKGETVIKNKECVNISFPRFFEELSKF